MTDGRAGPTAAPVTIWVGDLRGRYREVRVTTRTGRTMVATCSERDRVALMEDLPGQLDIFRGAVETLIPRDGVGLDVSGSPDGLTSALRKLSNRLASALVGERHVAELCRLLDDGAVVASSRGGRRAPSTVQVVLPDDDFDFPVELLRTTSSLDHDGAAMLRRHVGFQHVVRRVVAPSCSTRDISVLKRGLRCGQGPLAVATVTADSLRDSQQPVYLRDLRGHLTVLAVAPTTQDAVASVILGGHASAPGLVHVACHADTEGRLASGHALRFGSAARALDVHLRDLQALGPDLAHLDQPVVFLNACASSAGANGAAVGDFPAYLRGRTAPAVIGTLGTVNRAAANHVAIVFYQQLVLGSTLAQALLQARLHLLEVHDNPLGLLYTYSGDPDLRLPATDATDVRRPCRKESLAVSAGNGEPV